MDPFRSASGGERLIRWVGHPSAFADGNVLDGIVKGRVPVWAAARFRALENARVNVWPGKSEMVLGPAHGYSRTYVWGPQVFDVRMAADDWARLRRAPYDRFMFRDVTDAPEAPRPWLTKRQWQELLAEFEEVPPPTVVTAGSVPVGMAAR